MQPHAVGDENLRDLTLDFIAQHKKTKEPEVLFAMQAGSYAFNLNVASSDEDYFAVYAGHIDEVLSYLTPPPETFDGHTPHDHAIYEAANFCHLLLKGNPKVIEPLFVEHRCYQTAIWQELKELRQHFMTQNTVKHYVAYALAQISDVKAGKGTDTKKFYHAIRLLSEAESMVNGGSPRVWWEGPERDYLLEIRSGKYSVEELTKKVDEMQEKVQSKLASLPAKTELAVMNDWLVKLRMRTLKRLHPKMLTLPAGDSPLELRDRALELLATHRVDATVLAVIRSGSNTYGTEVAGSTPDYVGIYAVPTTHAVSLLGYAKKVDQDGADTPLNPTYTRGMLLLELGYACSLLTQGNHRLIEALFYDGPDQFETRAWKSLKENAKAYLTTTSVNHFMGVARGAYKKADTNKNLYHASRLMHETKNILTDGTPTLKEGDVAFLRKFREEKVDKEEFGKVMDELTEFCTKKLKESKLPQKPDLAPLTSLIVVVRKELA